MLFAHECDPQPLIHLSLIVTTSESVRQVSKINRKKKSRLSSLKLQSSRQGSKGSLQICLVHSLFWTSK